LATLMAIPQQGKKESQKINRAATLQKKQQQIK
jgi:hypothetical protein